MRKKTGHWLWVSTRGKMIEMDDDGKALRMVGILSDITERRRAEESLAHSRAELRAIYDHAPVKMCVVDANRRMAAQLYFCKIIHLVKSGFYTVLKSGCMLR